MKTLVDCDYVFDVLTRGPFPQEGEPKEPVERHLESCFECRRLAEALRPGVEIFHEVLSSDERKSLPVYWDEEALNEMNHRIIDAVHESTERAYRVEAVCRRWLSPAFVVAPIAAALLFFLVGTPLLNATFSRVAESKVHAEETLAGLSAAPCLVSMNTPDSMHESDNAAIACKECHENVSELEKPEGQLANKIGFHCCTSCHAAVSPNESHAPSSPEIAKMILACAVCHADNDAKATPLAFPAAAL